LNTPNTCKTYQDDGSIGFIYTVDTQAGLPVTLDKIMVYVTSLDIETEQVVPFVRTELDYAVATGFDPLCASQRAYLAEFWDVADIVIEGDDTLQRGIRFNMFHLLQSAGKDGHTNITKV
jgi:alpha,alpha-trehalose phosphorylase